MNWRRSSDELVDFYRVYRKLPNQASLQLLTTMPTRLDTALTDSLMSLAITGGVQYAVSAVDTHVTLPWLESAQAGPISVVGGHPGPRSLTAGGLHDNMIHLEWLDPSSAPAFAAAYDQGWNSTTVSGLGWWGTAPTAGWLATRFDLGAATTVTGVSARFTRATTAGEPVQVAVFADAGGLPGARALAVLDAVIMEPHGTFQNFLFNAPVTLPSGTFFVAIRQMGARTLALGGDEETPFISGTFFHNTNGTWEANEPALTAIPLLRALVKDAPLSAQRGLGKGPERPATKAMSFGAQYATKGASAQKTAAVDGKDAEPVELTSAAAMSAEALQRQAERAAQAVTAATPAMVETATEHHQGGNTLDQVVRYLIYRINAPADTACIDSVPAPQNFYNDFTATENVPFGYFVSARYDDAAESPRTNLVLTVRSNLAPGRPTDMLLTASGATMGITWADPVTNDGEDGSPVVDGQWVVIRRYLGTNTAVAPQMTDSVAWGVQSYVDTPPVQTQLYTWTLRARDEVPNYSPVESRAGIVESPWHEIQYEWVDITTTGTNLDLGAAPDDINLGNVPIGFSFPFYGQNYTQLRVCSNGWISFNIADVTTVAWAETNLPSTSVPNNAIYPFWDDLFPDPNAGHFIKYLSEPNRFVITWKLRKRAETNAITWQMQVILEPNGGVRIQYQGLPDLMNTATVGVENAAGTEGICLMFDQTVTTWIPRPQSAVKFWGGASGTVNGTVTQAVGGGPIQNVGVWGTTDTTTSEVVHTDAAGHYELRMMPGTYNLHFEHAIYCDSTVAVTILNNTAVEQAMTLKAPRAAFNYTSFALEAIEGHDTTATLTITNPGGPTGGRCTLEYTISDTSGWLVADPDTGEVIVGQSATITVHANVADYPLHASLHSALVVRYNAAGGPQTIPVDLDIVVDPDTLNAGHTDEMLPTEFALKQNYPNPFNPTTDLRFDVPRESFVKLVVYNVMGQEVATVVNERMTAGRHRVTFNAGTLPTGMYLVKMDADGFSGVSKMMLLK